MAGSSGSTSGASRIQMLIVVCRYMLDVSVCLYISVTVMGNYLSVVLPILYVSVYLYISVTVMGNYLSVVLPILYVS